MDYFLTRDEVAARIRAARREQADAPHRPDAPDRLVHRDAARRDAGPAVGPVADGGMVRPGQQGAAPPRRDATRITNKRQPPARIHARLLPHLRRWHRMDAAKGFTHVIRYQGEPVKKLRRSWGSVAQLAAKLTAERESKRTGKTMAPREA